MNLTISDSKVKVVKTKSQNIIKATWFLVLVVLMVTSIYIYRMIEISYIPKSKLPGNVFELWGFETTHWFEYMRQTIQSIGSIAIIIGITLIARGKKAFGPFNLLGNALIFVNGLITGLWFEATIRSIMFTLYAFQYANWNKRDKEGITINRANKFELLLSALIVILIVVCIATPLAVTGIGEKYLNMQTPFPDSIQGSFNIVGVWLIARRKTEGQLALVISNSSALIMFGIVGQPVMMVSTFAFLLVSFIAWIQWESMYTENAKNNFFYFIKYVK